LRGHRGWRQLLVSNRRTVQCGWDWRRRGGHAEVNFGYKYSKETILCKFKFKFSNSTTQDAQTLSN